MRPVAKNVLAASVELSPRQEEVIALMADGLTDREIAQELCISPRTVRMHSEVLRRKLGVTKRRHIIPMYFDLVVRETFPP